MDGVLVSFSCAREGKKHMVSIMDDGGASIFHSVALWAMLSFFLFYSLESLSQVLGWKSK